jgi:hypothetical protein
MDALDRLLQDDLNLLVDRLAGNTGLGGVLFTADEWPDLRARADALEEEIASGRAALLVQYARWRESLDELADLWSLAAAAHRQWPADDEPPPGAGLRAA